eukprot:TRINITY_DN9211_c0_g1_i4.p7 TRINITY_DN9211_c0_g1~~TRINITY_DN9211_c0_g1_i4.p7  ORF type:complete len:116 (+),score=5.37 TRINITY_DN9211_c0_g1_i4:1497-1844(+)
MSSSPGYSPKEEMLIWPEIGDLTQSWQAYQQCQIQTYRSLSLNSGSINYTKQDSGPKIKSDILHMLRAHDIEIENGIQTFGQCALESEDQKQSKTPENFKQNVLHYSLLATPVES